MDAEDLSELACLGNDTQEERQMKKRRFTELQDVLLKAFCEDKVEYKKTAAISSSTSRGLSRINGRIINRNKT